MENHSNPTAEQKKTKQLTKDPLTQWKRLVDSNLTSIVGTGDTDVVKKRTNSNDGSSLSRAENALHLKETNSNYSFAIKNSYTSTNEVEVLDQLLCDVVKKDDTLEACENVTKLMNESDKKLEENDNDVMGADEQNIDRKCTRMEFSYRTEHSSEDVFKGGNIPKCKGVLNDDPNRFNGKEGSKKICGVQLGSNSLLCELQSDRERIHDDMVKCDNETKNVKTGTGGEQTGNESMDDSKLIGSELLLPDDEIDGNTLARNSESVIHDVVIDNANDSNNDSDRNCDKTNDVERHTCFAPGNDSKRFNTSNCFDDQNIGGTNDGSDDIYCDLKHSEGDICGVFQNESEGIEAGFEENLESAFACGHKGVDHQLDGDTMRKFEVSVHGIISQSNHDLIDATGEDNAFEKSTKSLNSEGTTGVENGNDETLHVSSLATESEDDIIAKDCQSEVSTEQLMTLGQINGHSRIGERKSGTPECVDLNIDMEWLRQIRVQTEETFQSTTTTQRALQLRKSPNAHWRRMIESNIDSMNKGPHDWNKSLLKRPSKGKSLQASFPGCKNNTPQDMTRSISYATADRTTCKDHVSQTKEAENSPISHKPTDLTKGCTNAMVEKDSLAPNTVVEQVVLDNESNSVSVTHDVSQIELLTDNTDDEKSKVKCENAENSANSLCNYQISNNETVENVQMLNNGTVGNNYDDVSSPFKEKRLDLYDVCNSSPRKTTAMWHTNFTIQALVGVKEHDQHTICETFENDSKQSDCSFVEILCESVRSTEQEFVSELTRNKLQGKLIEVKSDTDRGDLLEAATSFTKEENCTGSGFLNHEQDLTSARSCSEVCNNETQQCHMFQNKTKEDQSSDVEHCYTIEYHNPSELSKVPSPDRCPKFASNSDKEENIKTFIKPQIDEDNIRSHFELDNNIDKPACEELETVTKLEAGDEMMNSNMQSAYKPKSCPTLDSTVKLNNCVSTLENPVPLAKLKDVKSNYIKKPAAMLTKDPNIPWKRSIERNINSIFYSSNYDQKYSASESVSNNFQDTTKISATKGIHFELSIIKTQKLTLDSQSLSMDSDPLNDHEMIDTSGVYADETGTLRHESLAQDGFGDCSGPCEHAESFHAERPINDAENTNDALSNFNESFDMKENTSAIDQEIRTSSSRCQGVGNFRSEEKLVSNNYELQASCPSVICNKWQGVSHNFDVEYKLKLNSLESQLSDSVIECKDISTIVTSSCNITRPNESDSVDTDVSIGSPNINKPEQVDECLLKTEAQTCNTIHNATISDMKVFSDTHVIDESQQLTNTGSHIITNNVSEGQLLHKTVNDMNLQSQKALTECQPVKQYKENDSSKLLTNDEENPRLEQKYCTKEPSSIISYGERGDPDNPPNATLTKEGGETVNHVIFTTDEVCSFMETTKLHLTFHGEDSETNNVQMEEGPPLECDVSFSEQDSSTTEQCDSTSELNKQLQHPSDGNNSTPLIDLNFLRSIKDNVKSTYFEDNTKPSIYLRKSPTTQWKRLIESNIDSILGKTDQHKKESQVPTFRTDSFNNQVERVQNREKHLMIGFSLEKYKLWECNTEHNKCATAEDSTYATDSGVLCTGFRSYALSNQLLASNEISETDQTASAADKVSCVDSNYDCTAHIVKVCNAGESFEKGLNHKYQSTEKVITCEESSFRIKLEYQNSDTISRELDTFDNSSLNEIPSLGEQDEFTNKDTVCIKTDDVDGDSTSCDDVQKDLQHSSSQTSCFKIYKESFDTDPLLIQLEEQDMENKPGSQDFYVMQGIEGDEDTVDIVDRDTTQMSDGTGNVEHVTLTSSDQTSNHGETESGTLTNEENTESVVSDLTYPIYDKIYDRINNDTVEYRDALIDSNILTRVSDSECKNIENKLSSTINIILDDKYDGVIRCKNEVGNVSDLPETTDDSVDKKYTECSTNRKHINSSNSQAEVNSQSLWDKYTPLKTYHRINRIDHTLKDTIGMRDEGLVSKTKLLTRNPTIAWKRLMDTNIESMFGHAPHSSHTHSVTGEKRGELNDFEVRVQTNHGLQPTVVCDDQWVNAQLQENNLPFVINATNNEHIILSLSDSDSECNVSREIHTHKDVNMCEQVAIGNDSGSDAEPHSLSEQSSRCDVRGIPDFHDSNERRKDINHESVNNVDHLCDVDNIQISTPRSGLVDQLKKQNYLEFKGITAFNNSIDNTKPRNCIEYMNDVGAETQPPVTPIVEVNNHSKQFCLLDLDSASHSESEDTIKIDSPETHRPRTDDTKGIKNTDGKIYDDTSGKDGLKTNQAETFCDFSPFCSDPFIERRSADSKGIEFEDIVDRPNIEEHTPSVSNSNSTSDNHDTNTEDSINLNQIKFLTDEPSNVDMKWLETLQKDNERVAKTGSCRNQNVEKSSLHLSKNPNTQWRRLVDANIESMCGKGTNRGISATKASFNIIKNCDVTTSQKEAKSLNCHDSASRSGWPDKDKHSLLFSLATSTGERDSGVQCSSGWDLNLTCISEVSWDESAYLSKETSVAENLNQTLSYNKTIFDACATDGFNTETNEKEQLQDNTNQVTHIQTVPNCEFSEYLQGPDYGEIVCQDNGSSPDIDNPSDTILNNITFTDVQDGDSFSNSRSPVSGSNALSKSCRSLIAHATLHELSPPTGDTFERTFDPITLSDKDTNETNESINHEDLEQKSSVSTYIYSRSMQRVTQNLPLSNIEPLCQRVTPYPLLKHDIERLPVLCHRSISPSLFKTQENLKTLGATDTPSKVKDFVDEEFEEILSTIRINSAQRILGSIMQKPESLEFGLVHVANAFSPDIPITILPPDPVPCGAVCEILENDTERLEIHDLENHDLPATTLLNTDSETKSFLQQGLSMLAGVVKALFSRSVASHNIISNQESQTAFSKKPQDVINLSFRDRLDICVVESEDSARDRIKKGTVRLAARRQRRRRLRGSNLPAVVNITQRNKHNQMRTPTARRLTYEKSAQTQATDSKVVSLKRDLHEFSSDDRLGNGQRGRIHLSPSKDTRTAFLTLETTESLTRQQFSEFIHLSEKPELDAVGRPVRKLLTIKELVQSPSEILPSNPCSTLVVSSRDSKPLGQEEFPCYEGVESHSEKMDECCEVDVRPADILQSSLQCLLEMLVQRGKITDAVVADMRGKVLAKTDVNDVIQPSDVSSIERTLSSAYTGMTKLNVFGAWFMCVRHQHERPSLSGSNERRVFAALSGTHVFVVGLAYNTVSGSCIREIQQFSELLHQRGL